MMFRNKSLLMAASLLFTPLVSAHTLSDAIQIALEKNPEILSARQGVGIAHEQVDQAEAGWMPTIDLTDDSGVEYKNKEGVAHTRLQKRLTALTLNQPLFDGGSTEAAVERKEQMWHSSIVRLEEVRSGVALKAIEAWYEVYRLQRVIKLVSANLQEHHKLYMQIKQKVDAGGADKAELLAAEAPWLQAKSTLTQTRGDYQDALATYEAVIGERPTGELKSALAVSESALPASVDDAVAMLHLNNYVLKAAESNIVAARADYEGSKSGLLPTLNLELKWGLKENEAGVVGTDQDYSALLKMSYNLFRGGADQSYRREMAMAMLDSQDQYAQARRSMEEQLHQFWNSIEVSSGLLQTSRQQLMISQENLESAREQFNLGEGDVMAIMAADDALLQSRKGVLTDQIDAQLGVYRLLSHMGVLLNHLEVPDAVVTSGELLPVDPNPMLVERIGEAIGEHVDPYGVNRALEERRFNANLAPGEVVAKAPISTVAGRVKESGWVVMNTAEDLVERAEVVAEERARKEAAARALEEQRLAEEEAARKAEEAARLKAMARIAKMDRIRRQMEYPKRQAMNRQSALKGMMSRYNQQMSGYNSKMRVRSQLLNQQGQQFRQQAVSQDQRMARINTRAVNQTQQKDRRRASLSRSGARQDAHSARVKQGLYRQAESQQMMKRAGMARAIRRLNGAKSDPLRVGRGGAEEDNGQNLFEGILDIFSGSGNG